MTYPLVYIIFDSDKFQHDDLSAVDITQDPTLQVVKDVFNNLKLYRIPGFDPNDKPEQAVFNVNNGATKSKTQYIQLGLLTTTDHYNDQQALRNAPRPSSYILPCVVVRKSATKVDYIQLETISEVTTVPTKVTAALNSK